MVCFIYVLLVFFLVIYLAMSCGQIPVQQRSMLNIILVTLTGIFILGFSISFSLCDEINYHKLYFSLLYNH